MANRIEVDETEYLASKQVASTMANILKHPEARKLVLKANKIVQPDVSIPEIDHVKPFEEAVAGVEAKLNDFMKSFEEEKAAKKAQEETNKFASKWEQSKRSLAQKHGYTEDGLTAIEKFCQERGIPDIEAGAALFDRLNPPAPIDTTSGKWDFFSAGEKSDDFMKQLFETRGQDDRLVDNHINKTLAEMRVGR